MNKFGDPVLAVFRVVVGILFAFHGAASLFGIFGGVRGTGAAVAFAQWPSWWAALIQFAGGALVAMGLGTRWAALLCSGSMAYAYFTVHQKRGTYAGAIEAVLNPTEWSLHTAVIAARSRAAYDR